MTAADRVWLDLEICGIATCGQGKVSLTSPDRSHSL